jgi:hypothetical protein
MMPSPREIADGLLEVRKFSCSGFQNATRKNVIIMLSDTMTLYVQTGSDPPKRIVFSAERNYVRQFHALHGVLRVNQSSPLRNRKDLMETKYARFLVIKMPLKTVR